MLKAYIYPPDEKLTLRDLNKVIQTIREGGDEPECLIVGYDQFNDLHDYLREHSRFMDVYEVKGMRCKLATYRGIPLYPVSFHNGHKCSVCNSSVQRAYIAEIGKIFYYCKDHFNLGEMLCRLEE
jgi:hypothetical protein